MCLALMKPKQEKRAWPLFLFGMLAFAGQAQAALTINSVTLNGGASVTVLAGTTVSVAVSETNTNGSNWLSTRFRTTIGGTTVTTCINTPDHNGNGTYSETFNITAPAATGNYTVTVRASNNNTCGRTTSNTITLTNGIIVAAPPTATTVAASTLSAAGATLNGTVSSNGAGTAVTFDYGLTTSYTDSATATASPLAANAANTAVSAPVTGLTCNTIYHFRVNGANSVGTANGSDLTFTTSACPTAPTVTTNAASALTATGATLNGTVSSNGAITAVTFDYGPDTNYGSSATATASPLAANAVNTAVSAAVTGLTCNTLHHFRVNGVNSAGTTNGNDLTFTTSVCPTPVTVTPASGGGAIPSNTAPGCGAAGTWTALTGPTIAETNVADIGLGNIVLSAPAGFEFNTAATVTIRLTGNGTSSRNINNIATGTSVAVTSISATAITFNVFEVGTRVNTLLWQGIQVRPTASTPLASGNLTHTGSSVISGVTASTNFGTLTEATSSPVCKLNAPTVTKSFNPTSVAGGTGTSTLTVTVTNPNASTISGLAFTDTYPTGITNAPTPALANTCGGTDTAGTGVLSLTGGTLTAGNSCSVSVNVRATAGAPYVNNTGAITSTNANSGTAASAILTAYGSATQLAFFQQPSNTVAGSPINPAVSVQIRDASNNLVATSTVPVTIAIGNNAGPGGVLTNTPNTLTVNAVAGVATFSNLSIDKAGTGYTLTATSSGLSSPSATSGSFDISLRPASKLAFSVQPGNAAPNTTLSPAIKVEIRDSANQVVTTSTATVTLAIGANPGSGTLAGTTSVAAVAGVATFSNLSINNAGNGYTLVASSSGLTDATSSAFIITPATTLAFFQQPSNTPAATPISPAVSVRILDAPNGNLVTTSIAPVTMTIQTNPGGGSLSGTVVVNAVGGVATFSDLKISAAGTGYTLKATSPGLTDAISGSFDITAPVCFTDDFERTGLLDTGYWTRTNSVGTTFIAEIVNGRLRLTDSVLAPTGEATAVHLNRLFPGFGNKVVAEFDYFAYNGTGADGLVMTLSDASIAPKSGAFGGSLGYAQKSNPGSDCNTAGGCPGFNGGWLGIGLDEYGNFSNPTEGRVDGPGFQANSVTVRGSGSGQSGYNYHARALATPISNSVGHTYRVTVDHSDSVHAYTTVERDIHTGLGYQMIIPQYDAKAIPTQAGVPTNWFFSFTASTGGLTNIHEIDNLTVCTSNPQVVPELHHVRIIHDGSALTCAPETITLKACANEACSALFTDPVTVNLNSISGTTWSLSNPVAITGGQLQLTLTNTGATGTVTLGGSTVTPVLAPVYCYNGATGGTCSTNNNGALTFSSNACAFDAVEQGKSPGTPIFTKLAATAFNVDVLALNAGVINTGYTSAITVGLVDMTDKAIETCTAQTSFASPTNSPTWVSGRRTYTFNYANAVKDVRVKIVGTTTACSSDNFAIRPTSFSVASPDANNTGNGVGTKIKAGAIFTLNATAANALGNTTTNYVGVASTTIGKAQINNNRISAHAGYVQTGTLSGSFSPAVAGISSGASFTYSEVGNFRFSPWGVYDDGSFAAVDSGKSECFGDGGKLGTSLDPNNPNAIDGNGMYGCYFGNTANTNYFGRFTPDHFAITPGTPVPGCGTFTYFGQDGFTTVFSLTALNAGGSLTKNYETSTSYAKLPLSTVWGATPGFTFTVTSPASLPTPAAIAASATSPNVTINTWAQGSATVTAKHKITRPTSPAIPTAVTVSALPVDSDGVTMTAASPVGSSEQRFGRLFLSVVPGSELLNLPVTVQTDYYDTGLWKTNIDDSCTQISTNMVAIGNYKSPLTSVTKCGFTPAAAPYTGTCKGTYTATATLSGGSATLMLNSAGITGGADIALNLTGTTANASCITTLPATTVAPSLTWLQGDWCGNTGYVKDPSAHITFGTKKSTFIYIREKY